MKSKIYALWKFERKKNGKGTESVFKTIMAENFPNLKKDEHLDPESPNDPK